MNKDIIGNIYNHVCCVYPFKGMIHMHLHYNYDKLNRTFYKIIDLKLWFISNFNEGEELYVKRISENAKYDFKKRYL